MNQAVSTKRSSGPLSRSPFRGLFPRSFFDEMFERYLSDTSGEIAESMNVSMDVAETDRAFEVKVDLPGIKSEDVDIQIDNNTLTIRGHRQEEIEEKNEEKQFHRLERYAGSFARSVVLPNSINEDETAAEFKDGVLMVEIPKPEEDKPRQISVDMD